MLDRYDSILIGGSGFIGTRLGVYLAEKGERVLNISRHQSEKPASDVDFTEMDFDNQEKAASFSLPRTDSLVILIGQIGPGFDPESDRRALQVVVDLVNAQPEPMKVLYCSTALVYGDYEVPARESDPLRPIEPYAKHKAENEAFLKNSLAKHHHLGVLRLSNVFGDIRSRGFISLVMNRFLAPSEEVFRVNGDGDQERDYIHIDDLVEAITAVKAGLKGHDTVNIATGESRTLLSILDTMHAVCDRKLVFEVTHQPVVEALKIRISNEHLQGMYGYMPRHTFAEGLTLMWNRARNEKSTSSL